MSNEATMLILKLCGTEQELKDLVTKQVVAVTSAESEAQNNSLEIEFPVSEDLDSDEIAITVKKEASADVNSLVKKIIELDEVLDIEPAGEPITVYATEIS